MREISLRRVRDTLVDFVDGPTELPEPAPPEADPEFMTGTWPRIHGPDLGIGLRRRPRRASTWQPLLQRRWRLYHLAAAFLLGVLTALLAMR